jgi:hypothetical protein
MRLVVAASAGGLALALAAPALAAYAPKLVVTQAGTTTTIDYSQAQTDDATAKIQIFAPPGWSLNANQTVGATIGHAAGHVVLPPSFGGAVAPVEGDVKVADPSQFTMNACAPGLHQMVVTLSLAVAGQSVTVPVYVDPVSAGPTSAFASALIQVCFTGPQQPPNVKVIDATFGLQNVFTPPSAPGASRWTATFTPYTNAGAPNPGGTVEAQSIVRTPATVSLKSKVVSRKKGIVRLSGQVRAAGSGAQASVAVRRVVGSSAKTIQTVRSSAGGAFKVNVKLTAKLTTFDAHATSEAQDVTQTMPCAPAIAPAGCSAVTLGPLDVTSNTIAVKKPAVPKKKKKKKR